MAGQEMSDRRSGQPVTIGDIEIEPIERVIIRLDRVGGGIVGMALKEPIALVFRSPAGTWRVDLDRLEGDVTNARR
jgi:hypothetical protein